MAMPQFKNACSGGHYIYNFGETLLSHHYHTPSMSEPCSRLDAEF